MELLFKREQSSGKIAKVAFKLWGKIELTDDETTIAKRYHFQDTILIYQPSPGLGRQSFFVGVLAAVVAGYLGSSIFGDVFGIIFAILGGLGVGQWYYHNNRETIFVKDLLHGRYFSCESVVQLAKQEAFLGNAVSFLRQVMESAKHWDGTETVDVPVLPKDEARQFIIQYG